MKEANLVAFRGARVLVLGVAFATLLAAALALGPDTALAAPQLEVEGSCEPGVVRPGPALMRCSVVITNSGDEAATNVRTSLQPSENCNLPNPAIPPLIYLYLDGELQPDTSLPLSLQLGDLPPGESIETVTQIAVRNLSAGRVGAELGVNAQGVSRIETDLCWTVDPSALYPSTSVAVTKSLVSPQPGPPGFHPEAVYDIVVANTGTEPVTALTLIDVIPPHLEPVASEPAATGSDGLGRPTWDLSAFGVSSIAPGGQVRVSVTLASPGDDCTNADNLAVAQSSVGGLLLDHVAFVDRTAQIGDCSQPEFCIYWAPDGENATEAPCDEPVCWSLAPGAEYYQPAYDCDANYCWFSPPGAGQAVLSPCDDEVCWIQFSEGGTDYYFNVPCDQVFCEYSSPDGSGSTRGSCDFPICWSSPPEGGRWEPVYGCGEFGEECWATPPFEGGSERFPCDLEPCFFQPPPGVIVYNFGQGSDVIPCEFAEDDLCWPVPPEGGEAYTYPVPCQYVESYCVFTPPDGGVSFVLYCEDIDGVCWGLDAEIAEYLDLPPDTLIPRLCEAGEEPTLPVPPVGVPAEAEPGTLTPMEIVEGTVETVDPIPSASAEPATLEPSSRVQPIGNRPPPPDDDDDEITPPIDTTSPPDGDDSEPPERLEDVLGLTKPRPANVTAPDSGYGYVEAGSGRVWLFIAATLGALGVVCGAAGVARRRT